MEDNEKIDLIKEEDQSFSNDDLFNITSWGTDPSVWELIHLYSEGDMQKPELQRMYVWEKKEASRFIESILLGLPVPSIFLANQPNQTKLIVDGYQRIMTVYYFYNNQWPDTKEEFRLSDTELINKKWRGKTYEELSDEDKRRFRSYTIHAIVFEQRHPRNDSALFQIFERINTSGKPLNAQEIRNCVYQGECNSILIGLNKDPNWRYYAGKTIDKRMLDTELILRFFALKDLDIAGFKDGVITLKKLLNEYMNNRRVMEGVDKQRMYDEFTSCIQFVRQALGEEAFYNYQADFKALRRKLYPTIYDSIMIATSIALSRGYTFQGSLAERREQLLHDESYRDNITQGTMRRVAIRNRVALALHYLYDMRLEEYA